MDMGTWPYRQWPLEDHAWSLAIPVGSSLGRDSQVSGFSGWTALGHAVVLSPLSLVPGNPSVEIASACVTPKLGLSKG